MQLGTTKLRQVLVRLAVFHVLVGGTVRCLQLITVVQRVRQEPFQLPLVRYLVSFVLVGRLARLERQVAIFVRMVIQAHL